MVSAMWHGTAPGLFYFSLGTFYLDFFFRNLKEARKPGPLKLVPEFVWSILSFMFLHFFVSDIGMPFVWKHYRRFNVMHRAFDYWPGILLPLFCVLSFLLPKERKDAKIGLTEKKQSRCLPCARICCRCCCKVSDDADIKTKKD